MSMEHTPGPWRAEGATVKAVSHGIWFKVTRADGRGHTREANINNAALIARAPELLAEVSALRAQVALLRDALERRLSIDEPNSGKWTKAETERSVKAWQEQARAALAEREGAA